MQESKYRDIVLIGFGNIYKNLLKYLINVREQWDFQVTVIEHEVYPTSRVQSVCESSGISFHQLKEGNEVLSCLLEFHMSTLIISAGNKYLFPQKLIERENVTIINFHNALLPAYPGRNAPSWAIYNGERYVGATWHIVTADVDAGAILWQKSCELSPDSKAYEASKAIMELAYQGFVEISEALFEGSLKSIPQKINVSERRIYYAKDVPGNGVVNLTDSPEYIYRVLRAMDFGLNPIFPKARIIVENEELCIIKKYSKELWTKEKSNESSKRYYLKLDDKYVLKLDVEKTVDNIAGIK